MQLALILLVLATTSWALSVTESFATETSGRSAEPIERASPKYPGDALVKSIEGWVLVNYTVKTDGKVSDLMVLDSSPVGIFEAAALEAVGSWTFKPALRNGEPIAQVNTKTNLSFTIASNFRGASSKFARLYNKAVKAIKREDLDKAARLIAEIEEVGTRSEYENSHFNILQGDYFRLRKEPHTAIRFYKRATTARERLIHVNLRGKFLKALFNLQIDVGDLWGALVTYDLIKTSTKIRADDPIHQTAGAILAHLQGNDIIVRSGQISDPCNTCSQTEPHWSHVLYRRSFSLDVTEGAISRFKLYCGFDWTERFLEAGRRYQVEELIEFSTANPGTCDLYLFGDSGTRFNLLEQ